MFNNQVCFSPDTDYAVSLYRENSFNDPNRLSDQIHGETFYINFYYSIFQFREKRITFRIFVSKNTKFYNNDMKL